MSLTCADVDFDLKLAEFKINGYAVFEDMIPEEKIDRIREAFLPLLAHIQERETEVSNVELGDPRIGQGRLQTTNRYTLTIPWIEPFRRPGHLRTPRHLRIPRPLLASRRLCHHLLPLQYSLRGERLPTLAPRHRHRPRDPPHRPRNRSGSRRQVPLGRDLGREWQL